MAGMLPGVEAARRRRFHQSNLNNGGRRSSFSLYATNYYCEFRISSASSMETEPVTQAECDDEKLEAAAREAKNRLDRRLQTHLKSQIKRNPRGRERPTSVEGRLKDQGHLQTDGCGSMRKSGC